MMNDEIAVEIGMHFELFLVDEMHSKKNYSFQQCEDDVIMKQYLLSSMRKNQKFYDNNLVRNECRNYNEADGTAAALPSLQARPWHFYCRNKPYCRNESQESGLP